MIMKRGALRSPVWCSSGCTHLLEDFADLSIMVAGLLDTHLHCVLVHSTRGTVRQLESFTHRKIFYTYTFLHKCIWPVKF